MVRALPTLLVTKLTACGRDVASTAGTDVRVDVLLPQGGLESMDVLGSRSVEGETIDFVVSNEVDVGTEGASDAGQLPCL